MTDSILIIEGEPSLSKELSSALTEAGFLADCVSSYFEALSMLDKFKPDMAIVDEVLQWDNGIEVCCQLRSNFGIPVILLGEDSSDEMWERVMEAEIDLYQVKPFSYAALVARVKAILRRYKKRRGL